MKYNDNGEYKNIVVKSVDTLPVGTEVDFDGSEVPSGWTEVTNLFENTQDNVSVANATGTNITSCSITAPRSGLALVIVNANFNANSSGFRSLLIAVNDSVSVPSTTMKIPAITASGESTAITTSKIIQVNEGDVICPRVSQNSGSSLNCNFVIQVAYL